MISRSKRGSLVLDNGIVVKKNSEEETISGSGALLQIFCEYFAQALASTHYYNYRLRRENNDAKSRREPAR